MRMSYQYQSCHLQPLHPHGRRTGGMNIYLQMGRASQAPLELLHLEQIGEGVESLKWSAVLYFALLRRVMSCHPSSPLNLSSSKRRKNSRDQSIRSKNRSSARG